MHVFLTIFAIAASATFIDATTSVTIEGVTDTLSDANEKYAPALFEGQSAFAEAQSIYDHSDFYQRRGWKKEHETRDGYSVYSKNTNKGRAFTISEILDASASDVMHEMWQNQMKSRVSLVSSDTIAKLGEQADLIRFGNAGAQMNVVRLYRQVPISGSADGYIMAMRTVSVPDQPNNVTGLPSLHLGAMRVRPDPIGGGRPRTFLDAVIILDLSGVADKVYAQQTASSMLTMLSEQAVRHFGEYSANYW